MKKKHIFWMHEQFLFIYTGESFLDILNKEYNTLPIPNIILVIITVAFNAKKNMIKVNTWSQKYLSMVSIELCFIIAIYADVLRLSGNT